MDFNADMSYNIGVKNKFTSEDWDESKKAMNALIRGIISVVLGVLAAVCSFYVSMHSVSNTHYTPGNVLIGKTALGMLLLSPLWTYALKRSLKPERVIPWSAWACLAMIILVLLIRYCNS
jgi:hypothetical protein